MSATLQPVAAYTTAFHLVKKPGPMDNVKEAILQDASSHLWHLAPWRWTLGALTAVSITNAQEFTATIPGDFLRLERAWIVTTQGAQPLTITGAESPLMTINGTPKSITFVSPDKLRLNCTYPAGALDSPTLRVLYKKKAPDLSGSGITTGGALVMDDDYFYLYRSLVLYHAYKFADDPRAGGATVALQPSSDRPQVQYTGQLGIVMAQVEELREREPLLFDLLDTAPAEIRR